MLRTPVEDIDINGANPIGCIKGACNMAPPGNLAVSPVDARQLPLDTLGFSMANTFDLPTANVRSGSANGQVEQDADPVDPIVSWLLRQKVHPASWHGRSRRSARISITSV